MSIQTRSCERCRGKIPPERIEALPETRLCVECSRKVGGDFEVTVVPENIGKSGSLKKNYGSFSLRRRRRRIQPLED